MKKKRYSFTEKKALRTIILFVLIQILIIVVFVRMFSISQPVNINETKQINIIVEDTYFINTTKDNWLIVVADSNKYLFENHSILDEYSVNQLYESISKGDILSLKYHNEYNFLGRVNLVVDARSEGEIYRTIEGYNRQKQGIPVFIALIFSIIEVVFVGIVIVYVWLNYNIVKGIHRKNKDRGRLVRKTEDGSVS